MRKAVFVLRASTVVLGLDGLLQRRDRRLVEFRFRRVDLAVGSLAVYVDGEDGLL